MQQRILVHAFVAAAAQVLQLEVPTGSVKEVAEKVIERFVHLPSVSLSEHTEIDSFICNRSYIIGFNMERLP